MSKKKHKKNKNKYKDNYYLNNKKSKSYVSSKEIQAIAYQVFGSTYYTSNM